ncbi:MAG: hypothetical protein JWL94_1573 [Microbacteriaceae bacterium]|nr:hypothetical protein [Microbacteriaceae bacterium]
MLMSTFNHDSINHDSVGIEHYASVLKRRWRMMIGGALVGFVAILGYLTVVGEKSVATTDINLTVISDDPFNAGKTASELLDATTESQIARSYAVAVKAADALGGGTTPAELRQNLEVSVVADATVISLSYKAPTAEEAVEGSSAIADAYLSYRAAQAQARVNGVTERIDARLEQLRVELGEANGRGAAAASGSSEANQARSDQDLIVIEIDSLLNDRNSLALIDTAGGSVLSSAVENEVEVTPDAGLMLTAGVLGGLVLGVILAFLLTAFTRRVQRVEDVERATGVRGLLERPASHHAAVPETGAMMDSLRVARERLFATLNPRGAVVAVIDDTTAHQPSDLPVNLAVAAARAGQKTLVLAPNISPSYLDLLKDKLSLQVLELNNEGVVYGSSIVAGLTLGVGRHSHSDDADDREFATYVRDVIDTAGEDVFVLLTLPPRASHASELAAARLADAVIMVAVLGRSRKKRISETVEELALVGSPFLGALITDRRRRLRSDKPVALPDFKHSKNQFAAVLPRLGEAKIAASSRSTRSAANSRAQK